MAAHQSPAVAETGEDKLPAVSHWKTVSPSDITSKIVYTLTPEQGVAQLKNQTDIAITSLHQIDNLHLLQNLQP